MSILQIGKTVFWILFECSLKRTEIWCDEAVTPAEHFHWSLWKEKTEEKKLKRNVTLEEFKEKPQQVTGKYSKTQRNSSTFIILF